jgi:rare lipoprotein A
VACGSSSTVSSETGATERGEASYYADKFVGRQTASGETYTHDALTAAHRTLPFGTRVRVRRLDTGATVVVRINDRGPFKRGRIIDLSKEAARRIGLLRAGIAEVEIEVLNGDDRTSDTASRPERSRQDDDTSTSW